MTGVMLALTHIIDFLSPMLIVLLPAMLRFSLTLEQGLQLQLVELFVQP